MFKHSNLYICWYVSILLSISCSYLDPANTLGFVTDLWFGKNSAQMSNQLPPSHSTPIPLELLDLVTYPAKRGWLAFLHFFVTGRFNGEPYAVFLNPLPVWITWWIELQKKHPNKVPCWNSIFAQVQQQYLEFIPNYNPTI